MRIHMALACFALLAGCGSTVDSKGTGGAGGHGATSSSQGSTGGSGGTTNSTGTTGGAPAGCDPGCDPGFVCCGSACVNTANDIFHCGDCKTACGGDHPFCAGGSCGTPPCEGQSCNGSSFCCGSTCCDTGMLCCDVQGPGPTMGPTCEAPVNGTCPLGCPTCE